MPIELIVFIFLAIFWLFILICLQIECRSAEKKADEAFERFMRSLNEYIKESKKFDSDSDSDV